MSDLFAFLQALQVVALFIIANQLGSLVAKGAKMAEAIDRLKKEKASGDSEP